MLTRMHVSNYKCFGDFEFKPGRQQLVLGLNGSGKTTFLRVIRLLQDLVVREALNPQEFLLGSTRTVWKQKPQQHFEFDVEGNGGTYTYRLIVGSRGDSSVLSVDQESLTFNQELLFLLQNGKILSFGDKPNASDKMELPFRLQRSGLAVIDAQVNVETAKISWFKSWLSKVVAVQINPWKMSTWSERETSNLDMDMGNFADWYRHLRVDRAREVIEALHDLSEAIGLEALDLKEAGLGTRSLIATLTGPDGITFQMSFGELSEGQRCLIALYLLLHCAADKDSTIIIDEPDNFIALSEIQPWLMKLLDRVDEKNAQIILISHHPELLNQMAARGGVIFDRRDGSDTKVLPFPMNDTGLSPAEIVAQGWENE